MKHKKALFVLFLVVSTELIGFGIIIPVLPQLALNLNVSSFAIGVLMAVYSLAQFFAAPVLGGLSDQYGRKPLLVMSKIGSVVGYCVLAIANTYGLFFLARLIDGITGGNISIARAYVADITTPEERPKGMAVIGMAFGFGFIVGPALGGILYSHTHGQFWAALAAAAASLVATILTIFLLKEPEKRAETYKHTPLSLIGGFLKLNSKFVMGICAIQFVFMTVFSGFETSFSVFTHHTLGYNVHQNSFLFVGLGLITLCVQGFVTRKKVSKPAKMVQIGLVLALVSFLGLALSSVLSAVLISLVPLAIGIALVGVYLPALLSTLVDADVQGHTMGIYEGFGSLSRVMGPLVTFSLFGLLYAKTYLVFSGVLFVLSLVFYGFQKTVH